MKKTLFLQLSLALSLYVLQGFSQVGINQGGFAPAESAMLDVSALDKGFLVPRVSLVAIDNSTDPIASPVKGLLIYNLNSTLEEGFYFWDGNMWSAVATMEDVNNVVNIATEDAFGELYECHDFESSTILLMSDDSTWHGWGTCATGDTCFVSSSLSGGIKCLNIEREGYYAVKFTCTVEGTAAGFTVDAGLFKNGSLQNDIRGRIEFSKANTQEQIEFSGIIHLLPGDVVDVRFMGDKDKEMHLKLGSLSVYQID